VSLLPLIGGATIPAETATRLLFWEHEGNAAVRLGDWKLVREGLAGSWELYDMASDRTELHNLAVTYPGKVGDLASKWEAWAERAQVTPYPTTGVIDRHAGQNKPKTVGD
jgi:arylsulfatase